MSLNKLQERGDMKMKKDNIWTVLDDSKEQETRQWSKEADDIFAGKDALSKIIGEELPL